MHNRYVVILYEFSSSTIKQSRSKRVCSNPFSWAASEPWIVGGSCLGSPTTISFSHSNLKNRIPKMNHEALWELARLNSANEHAERLGRVTLWRTLHAVNSLSPRGPSHAALHGIGSQDIPCPQVQTRKSPQKLLGSNSCRDEVNQALREGAKC